MRAQLRSVLMILLGTSLVACQQVTNVDKAKLATELLQADRDFASLSEAEGPKTAFAAFLAENALMLPRNGDPVEGLSAAIARFPDDRPYELLWQPRLAEVADSGELGWTWGTYQVVVDQRVVSRGKYVNIWNRQINNDGNPVWKVRMDMGNQQPEDRDSEE